MATDRAYGRSSDEPDPEHHPQIVAGEQIEKRAHESEDHEEHGATRGGEPSAVAQRTARLVRRHPRSTAGGGAERSIRPRRNGRLGGPRREGVARLYAHSSTLPGCAADVREAQAARFGIVSEHSSVDVAERIVLRAMSRDASLDEELTRRFVALVLEYVADDVAADDAPELARRLIASAPTAGASAASVVAAAATDVLTDPHP